MKVRGHERCLVKAWQQCSCFGFWDVGGEWGEFRSV